MSDFYGMEPGKVPGFAEVGSGKFISVEGLPDRTVRNMAAFMQRLRACITMTLSRSRYACGTSQPPQAAPAWTGT